MSDGRAALIFAVVRKDLRLWTRDRFMFMMSAGVIIIYAVAFWFLPDDIDETLRLGVTGEGAAQLEAGIQKMAAEQATGEEDAEGFKLVTFESREKLVAELEDGEMDLFAGLVLPGALREAAARGVPIVRYARTANGAIDYGALAVELEALGLLVDDELPSIDDVPREVVVRFRDQSASDVRIAGDFNGWVPDKGVRSLIESEGETRVWTKILQLAPGQYEYRYVVDGEWREDPDNSEGLPAGPARSVLVVR